MEKPVGRFIQNVKIIMQYEDKVGRHASNCISLRREYPV
jgi:hypothetical protein